MSSVASLRQIRRRIRSVENTKKITRAMEMVAAAKLRRFQDFLESARPYTEKMESLATRLLDELPADYSHPLLKGQVTETWEPGGRSPISKNAPVALVLFTSDTGLCGTYNGELEEAARNFIQNHPQEKISFIFVGKHGASAFHKKDNPVLGLFSDLRVSRVDEILKGLRETVVCAFLSGKVTEVHALYSRMETLSRYEPVTETLLPISKGDSPLFGDTRFCLSPFTFIVEPDRKTVIDKLIPAVLEAKLRFIFYHALLTEQIARMSAMRQATQNAKEMIEELTLLRNKARQAAITKEIIEVVSGSRAQKLK
ncbi:MAG: ATP synthase F1 subunit gamma [Candidatus Omnitrophica bacterium]|nr:ATP synthase F1 subunit gamma [Candidatus Omnitrophota bacterium]